MGIKVFTFLTACSLINSSISLDWGNNWPMISTIPKGEPPLPVRWVSALSSVTSICLLFWHKSLTLDSFGISTVCCTVYLQSKRDHQIHLDIGPYWNMYSLKKVKLLFVSNTYLCMTYADSSVGNTWPEAFRKERRRNQLGPCCPFWFLCIVVVACHGIWLARTHLLSFVPTDQFLLYYMVLFRRAPSVGWLDGTLSRSEVSITYK